MLLALARTRPLRWTLASALLTLVACGAFGESETDAEDEEPKPSSSSGTSGTSSSGGSGRGDAGADGGDMSAPPDPYAQVVLADDPVAFYRFSAELPRDPEAPQVYDEVSKQARGRRYESVDTIVGALGDRALHCTSGNIRLGNEHAFVGAPPHTIELWMRPDEQQFFGHIVTKEDRDSPKSGWAIFSHGDDVVYERFVNNGDVKTFMAVPVAAELTHVVVTYTGARIQMYRNGEAVNTMDAAKNDSRSMPPIQSDFLIGSERVGAREYPYRGVVDDVAIYSKALTADRIRAHFQARKLR